MKNNKTKIKDVPLNIPQYKNKKGVVNNKKTAQNAIEAAGEVSTSTKSQKGKGKNQAPKD